MRRDMRRRQEVATKRRSGYSIANAATQKRIVLLEEAGGLIQDAIDKIKEAVKDTGQLGSSVNVYLVGWLKKCIANDSYPAHNGSIPEVIKRIKERFRE